MNDIKVLIIEDEPLIAEDIAACLKRSDYRVSGIVYSAEDALPELARNPPDIAMIDINLNGGQEGIAIASAINERFYIPFVYLTSYSDRRTLELAKNTEPSGYIVKPFTEAGLCATLEIALHNYAQKNKQHYPDLVLHKINQHLPSPLSLREFDVIQLIYEGCSNHQIAGKLFVSNNTVKVHIKNAYLKLDAVSRSTVIVRLRELMLK
jgi:DNA-binding NarL/FixJ family response regulator